jgi:hypothetical protein
MTVSDALPAVIGSGQGDRSLAYRTTGKISAKNIPWTVQRPIAGSRPELEDENGV